MASRVGLAMTGEHSMSLTTAPVSGSGGSQAATGLGLETTGEHPTGLTAGPCLRFGGNRAANGAEFGNDGRPPDRRTAFSGSGVRTVGRAVIGNDSRALERPDGRPRVRREPDRQEGLGLATAGEPAQVGPATCAPTTRPDGLETEPDSKWAEVDGRALERPGGVSTMEPGGRHRATRLQAGPCSPTSTTRNRRMA